MGEIIQIRDYQNRKDIERLYAELKPFTETESFTDTAPSEIIPYGGEGIDGMTFTAPDSDPA